MPYVCTKLQHLCVQDPRLGLRPNPIRPTSAGAPMPMGHALHPTVGGTLYSLLKLRLMIWKCKNYIRVPYLPPPRSSYGPWWILPDSFKTSVSSLETLIVPGLTSTVPFCIVHTFEISPEVTGDGIITSYFQVGKTDVTHQTRLRRSGWTGGHSFPLSCACAHNSLN